MKLPITLLGLLFAVASLQAGETVESNPMPLKTKVTLETTQGTIELRLFADVAPKTVENFTSLAEQGYYDGIIFHRVIPNFMIQGGDPTGTGRGGKSKWGRPFEDEVKQEVGFDKVGLLAMANSGPGTNGSQFFITTAKTPWLHMRHTIFGEVVSGYDVVQKIEQTPKGPGDRPLEDQKIIKATVSE
jgi:peptidylprolyl isomerase